MDGMVNWESSQVGDSARFSQKINGSNKNKDIKSFEKYLKKKEIRAAARKLARKKATNQNKKVLEKELPAT